MKGMSLLPLFAGCACILLSACASGSAQEYRNARAAAACIDNTDEAERKTCHDAELAAMNALERQEQQERQNTVLESERREALREAYGIPKKYTRDTVSGGMIIPGERKNP